jgi:invasion protein IalB
MRPTLTACAVLLLTCVTSAADAEPRIASERFDDWFYRCVDNEKGKDKQPARCEAVQIAQTKEGDKAINLLTISLSELTQEKKKDTVLTVLAPLNVFLPAGLELSVDGGKPVTLQYRNCNNAGCWLQHIIDEKTLLHLTSGKSGLAKIRLINGQNLNIKFSLKGLKGALHALQTGRQPKDKS